MRILLNTDYQRWSNNSRIGPSEFDRFIARCKEGPTMPHMSTPCIEWTGSIDSICGRATFRLRNKTRNAARVAYMHWVGDIPDGMNVCHECDNPKCVNHEHLFLGTQADNVRDMWSKGRHAHQQAQAEITRLKAILDEHGIPY